MRSNSVFKLDSGKRIPIDEDDSDFERTVRIENHFFTIEELLVNKTKRKESIIS